MTCQWTSQDTDDTDSQDTIDTLINKTVKCIWFAIAETLIATIPISYACANTYFHCRYSFHNFFSSYSLILFLWLIFFNSVRLGSYIPFANARAQRLQMKIYRRSCRATASLPALPCLAGWLAGTRCVKRIERKMIWFYWATCKNEWFTVTYLNLISSEFIRRQFYMKGFRLSAIAVF